MASFRCVGSSSLFISELLEPFEVPCDGEPCGGKGCHIQETCHRLLTLVHLPFQTGEVVGVPSIDKSSQLSSEVVGNQDVVPCGGLGIGQCCCGAGSGGSHGRRFWNKRSNLEYLVEQGDATKCHGASWEQG